MSSGGSEMLQRSKRRQQWGDEKELSGKHEWPPSQMIEQEHESSLEYSRTPAWPGKGMMSQAGGEQEQLVEEKQDVVVKQGAGRSTVG